MKSFLSFLAVLPLAAVAVAQDSSVYFSTRYAETPNSGRGGFIVDQASPCLPTPVFGIGFVIESAVANSQGVSYVTPGVLNTTILNDPQSGMTNDFVEVSNFPQYNLYLGDMDGDGVAHESTNFRGVDAMYIPTPAFGRPNNIHEMFVSVWSDSSGSTGYTTGGITESDMVLLPSAATDYPVDSPSQPLVYFIRRADWITLLGLSAGFSGGIDVNAFTVDQVTGDLYCSFDNGSIAGASLILSPGTPPVPTAITRGDIIRIPAAAYTPSGPYGAVTSPSGGMAERVYTAANVVSMVGVAGGTITVSGTVNVYGLSMDPAVAPVAAPTGFMTPALLFTIFNQGGSFPGAQNSSSSAIYSTAGGGAFATLNGVTMDQPAALGMNNQSFSNGFYAGPADALAVVQHAPNLDPIIDRPVHLDTYPTSGLLSDPTYNGRLVCYVSGLPPGAIAAVFARLDAVPPGGWVSRTGVSGAVPGYPDLYVDPLGLHNTRCVIAPQNSIVGTACQIPVAQIVFNNLTTGTTNDPSQSVNPIASFIDPTNGAENGDTCFELNLASVFAPGAVPPTPTPILTFQVLDLSTARLSSPIALQFN